MPRSPINSVGTAERVSEAAQAAPPSLDCSDGQAAQASLAAGRCWFAGHAPQLAGFERESWCGGQSTQAPSATRRAGPQPHASPGRLVRPDGQAVQAVAAPVRCWSLGHGSQSVFAEFGTRCGGQVSQAPSFSYCRVPLHSGAKTRTTKVVSAVSPAWLVAPTEKRWRPGTVPPGGDSAISKRGLSVATTVQLVCGSHVGAESPAANSKSTRSCTSAPTAPTAMRSVCPGRTSRSEPTSMVGGAAPATAAQASSQVDASAASVGRPLAVPSADEDKRRPPQTLSQWQVRPVGVWAQPRHQPKGMVLGAWCPTPCATMCE